MTFYYLFISFFLVFTGVYIIKINIINKYSNNQQARGCNNFSTRNKYAPEIKFFTLNSFDVIAE